MRWTHNYSVSTTELTPHICSHMTCEGYEWNSEFVRSRPDLFPATIRHRIVTFAATRPVPRYLLKKNLRFSDTDQGFNEHDGFPNRIRSNNEGFRGPDFSRNFYNGVRIFAVGESTTFGSGDEGASYPDYLRTLLKNKYPRLNIDVVNAGLIGSDIADHQALIEMIANYKPHFILYYSGHNSIHAYNFFVQNTSETRLGAWENSLPPWAKLLMKNSALFRTLLHKSELFADHLPEVQHTMIWDPQQNGLAEYKRQLGALADICRDAGAQLVLATLVTKLDKTDLLQQDRTLPEVVSIRKFYFPLSLEEVDRVYKLMNAVIRNVADEKGVPLVDFTQIFPFGTEYFLDDLLHFSALGNSQLANGFASALEARIPTVQQ